MISGVTVKSLIHCQLIFEWCKKWVQLQLFFHMWISNFLSTTYWRLFSTEYSWLPCHVLVDHIDVGLFLCSVHFHWFICLFLGQYQCFDDLLYNIAWNQEVWYLLLCSSFSGFLWLFWVFFGFIYILRVFFSCEKCHWTLDRDCIESVDSFWQ